MARHRARTEDEKKTRLLTVRLTKAQDAAVTSFARYVGTNHPDAVRRMIEFWATHFNESSKDRLRVSR